MRELDMWVEAGAVLRPHGIVGEAIVLLNNDLLELVSEAMTFRTTRGANDEELVLTVERVRKHKGRLIIKFKGYETRDEVAELRSRTIWMSRDQIGSLDEDRWLIQDLVGMIVLTDDGERLGTLTDVMHHPANDVFVVAAESGELLLPVIDDVVLDVDIEGGRMTVHLLEGLR
ncbi:ribosome maturation factor RimM [bacterium]|nr:ribosome maturation factor RimM [bacterium]